VKEREIMSSMREGRVIKREGKEAFRGGGDTNGDGAQGLLTTHSSGVASELLGEISTRMKQQNKIKHTENTTQRNTTQTSQIIRDQ
jgi:hypothetical protein